MQEYLLADTDTTYPASTEQEYVKQLGRNTHQLLHKFKKGQGVLIVSQWLIILYKELRYILVSKKYKKNIILLIKTIFAFISSLLFDKIFLFSIIFPLIFFISFV
jgi:hypothetical protein